MPTEPEPVTVAHVIHRAVEACDPNGEDADLDAVLTRYEDADEPVTAVADFEQRLAEATGSLDPQAESPVLQVAAAVAVYLAHRRDELGADPDELIRLAVRSEMEGHPSPVVGDWLVERGLADQG